MATNDDKRADQEPEVKMPDVGTPAPRTAGKWVLWFIIIFAIVLICTFIF